MEELSDAGSIPACSILPNGFFEDSLSILFFCVKLLSMEKIVETISYEKVKEYDYIRDFFGDKKVCMFDIETTGLSADYSFTYIIGINIFDGETWQIIQLFNDDGTSEPEMIRVFQDLIKDYDVLVEFNGDRFDIPYIRKRMGHINRKYSISLVDNFDKVVPFDLMKCVKPHKFALGLPNIKQKTIEKYFGINRLDMYNGGQLIDVYLDYLSTNSEKNRKLVLRHNRDDMEGMILLGGILSLEMLTRGRFEVNNISVKDKNGVLYLCIDANLERKVLHDIFTSAFGCSLEVKDSSVKLQIPIYVGAMTYYFGNKKNDGFTEREGYFAYTLPGYIGEAALYKEKAGSKDGYIMLEDSFLSNTEMVHQYVTHMIDQIMLYKGV